MAKLDPRPADAAFLVQEFVGDGVEVFAGVSRDPDFGLSIAFGLGGIAIEIMRDFALAHAAAARGRRRSDDRRDAGRGTARRDARQAGGGRQRRSPSCLYALADFAWHNADSIAEIDLNPIKALPEGRGCVVVDALIVTRQKQG